MRLEAWLNVTKELLKTYYFFEIIILILMLIFAVVDMKIIFSKRDKNKIAKLLKEKKNIDVNFFISKVLIPAIKQHTAYEINYLIDDIDES